MTNNERADRAQALLATYHYRRRPPSPDHMDAEDYFADLLADFMHLADREGFDFSALARRAAVHHEAEAAGE
jgi:hypothetical protein